MRYFVHFLGYSKVEGGIMEFNSTDVFSIGSLNIETLQRDFDNFEISLPWNNIFEVKPAGIERFSLCSELSGNKFSTNSAVIKGARALENNEKLWIENERVQVYPGIGDNYSLSRGFYDSFSVSHNAKKSYSDLGTIDCITKRISPIGLIAKVYTDEKILAYGQVIGLKYINSGFVKVSFCNLYKQIEREMIRPNNRTLDLKRFMDHGELEFFSLLEYPSFSIYVNFQKEELKTSTQYIKVKDLKKAFEQLLLINNAFLSFKDGKYIITEMKRSVKNTTIENRLIERDININETVFEVELFPPYSTIKITKGDIIEQFDASDSNFSAEYTTAKKLTMDLSAIDFDLSLVSLSSIAKNKLFLMNNIIEQISFSCDRYNLKYEVGKYYRFLDIFRFSNFYKKDTENVFLCIGIESTKYKFVRFLPYETSLIAPSFLVVKTNDETYQLYNILNVADFIYTNSDDLTLMINSYTLDTIWKLGDVLTLIDTDAAETNCTLTGLTSDTFYLSPDIGSNGDLFIITIQSNTSFASLPEKNQVYLYEGEGKL